MREIGSIREFDNGTYKLIEDKIIPEQEKKSFIIKMNVYALLFTFIGIIIVLMIIGSGTFELLNLSLYIIGFFVFIVVHELLHGISFVLDKNITWKNIKFGLVLKSGMAYCISTVPVKVNISKISLMMPVYVVCLPMIIIGIILNDAALAVAGIFYLSGSAGDIYYMWKLRKTDKNLYMFEEMPVASGYEVGYLLYKKIK